MSDDKPKEGLGMRGMKQVLTAACIAAGVAAFGVQAGAEEMRVPASLTSFGAVQTSHALSAAMLDSTETFSQNPFAGSAVELPVTYVRAVAPQSFAASTALSVDLALDAGYNLDLTQRFDNYGARLSPLLDQASFLGLANGGRYAGLTFVPSPDLRFRVGAQFKSNQLDGQVYDPTLGLQNLPLTWNSGEQRSFLAGMSWDLSDWAGVNLTGIVNEQKGQPAGSELLAGLVPGAITSALNVSAHVDFGGGWVTTAAFSDGLTQLDQKSAATSLESQSYSLAIAKHGLFGEDALGFSLSRPSSSLIDNSFDIVAASGDLPPVFIANNRPPGTTTETDLQLGYVTSFLDGALALQANAAYQMNYQGQTGANSLSVLSRAKIKF
jgi:hypothetical protein